MKVVNNIQHTMLNSGENIKSPLGYTMRYNLAVNQRKIYIYDEIDDSTIFEVIYFLEIQTHILFVQKQ